MRSPHPPRLGTALTNFPAPKHPYLLGISVMLWPLGFSSLPAGRGAWIPAHEGVVLQPQPQLLSWLPMWRSSPGDSGGGHSSVTSPSAQKQPHSHQPRLQESHTYPAHPSCRMLRGDIPSHSLSLSQGTPSWSLFSFSIGNNTVLAQLHRMKMDLRISLFAGPICRDTGPSLPPLANSCQHFVVPEGLSAQTPLPASSSPSYKGSPHLRVGYPRGELYRPRGAARIRTPALPQANSQVRRKRLP